MLAAAVLGSPIDHSLSPLLHESAYRALGLNDWTYTQIECTASDLPRIVSAADPGMRGFSVTRPCKDAALRFADVVSERAHIVESANTLIRRGTEWYADCTDIDGACASLKKSGYTGGNVLLLGAGGTSRPYLSALRSAGVEGVGRVAIASRAEERAQHTLHVAARLGLDYSWIPLNDPEILRASCHNATLVISTLPGDAAAGVEGVGRVAIASRAEERAQHTLHVAARLGLDYSWIPLNDPEILRASCHNATLVISTLPGDAAAGYSTFLRRTPRLIDVTYAPWPTSLAQVVADNGGTVVGGRTMLLHQAVAQIEAFTQKTVTDDVFAAMVASLQRS